MDEINNLGKRNRNAGYLLLYWISLTIVSYFGSDYRSTDIENLLLIVVTEKPASGKTSLVHLLSGEIRFSLLSRDEFQDTFEIKNNG